MFAGDESKEKKFQLQKANAKDEALSRACKKADQIYAFVLHPEFTSMLCRSH